MLSWPLAAALLVSAPLLTPLIAKLGGAIGVASKASQAAANDVSAAADEIVENIKGEASQLDAATWPVTGTACGTDASMHQAPVWRLPAHPNPAPLPMT